MPHVSAAAILLLLSSCSAIDIEPAGAPIAVLNIMIGLSGKYADERGSLPRKHTPFLRIWAFRISSGGRVTWDKPLGAPGEELAAGQGHFPAPHLRFRLGKDVVYFQVVFRW